MIHRILSSATGLACLLLAVLVIPAHAQEWEQEVQIITTVRPGEPIFIFLDSLTAAFERNPDVRLRRSADAPEALAFKDFRSVLLEDGVDLNSASHAFIRYRFSLSNQGTNIVESIEDLYFISRFDEDYTDLPILYVSAQNPIVSDVLVKRGIPKIANMKSVTPFRELLAFPLLQTQQETAMVELAGRALRDDFVAQREALLKFLNDHLTLVSGQYTLTTRYERIASPPAAPDSTTAAASLR
jgi:GAF domain-containing protein